MTPTPPAATAPRSDLRHARSASVPGTGRRASGPEPSQRRARVAGRTPARPGLAGAATAPPFGLRLARRAASLPDGRLLDRLLRGRLWIAILAASLVGIVFLQITLLELNTGISRAVQTTQTLERQNTELKLDLSRLAGGERVRESAAAMGLVAPTTGRPRFLDARKASAERAAANISAPGALQQLPLGGIPAAEGETEGVTPEPVADEVLTAPGGDGVPAGAVAAGPGGGTAAAAAVPTTKADPAAAPGIARTGPTGPTAPTAATAPTAPTAPVAAPAHVAHGPVVSPPAPPAAAVSAAPSPPSGGSPVASAGGRP